MEQRKRKNHFDLKANAIEAQISDGENGNIEQKTHRIFYYRCWALNSFKFITTSHIDPDCSIRWMGKS